MDERDQEILDALPAVTEEMMDRLLRETADHVMTPEERAAQMLSFVWGQDLEGNGTMDDVRRNLGLPST